MVTHPHASLYAVAVVLIVVFMALVLLAFFLKFL